MTEREEAVKVASSLSRFFNIPLFLANEKPSKYTKEMHVSYDAARRIQITFVDASQNVEAGPGITLSRVMQETDK